MKNQGFKKTSVKMWEEELESASVRRCLLPPVSSPSLVVHRMGEALVTE